MRKTILAALAVILVLALAACSGGSGGKAPAASAVENYLKAVVSKDAAKVSNLSCKTWEQQALLEMDGFQAVKAELDNVACTAGASESGATLVNCTGKIAMTYNTEKQTIDVSRQTYKVVQEGGDWRVCGYQ